MSLLEAKARRGRTGSQNWEITKLRNCLLEPPKYGINAAATTHSPDLPVYLRITDISSEGRFDPRPRVSVDHPLSQQYFLEDGDVVFARTGASVGKSYQYKMEDGRLVFAGFLIRVRCNTRILMPSFLAQFAKTSAFWDWVATESARTGQPGINAVQLSELVLHLPPISEQAAICESLDDADLLIEALDTLIAKKCAIKQGAMQQLLTSKNRLPGFSGEWGPVRLGDFSTMRSGGTPASTTKEFYDGSIPWVSISDMTSSGKYLSKSEKGLSQLGLKYSSAVLYEAPILLYAMYASLGETCIARQEVSSSQAILGISPHSDLDLEFLYYQMLSYREVVKTLGQQGTQSNLNKGMVQDFQVLVPPTLDEQKAVAQILTDMDGEIDALVARREKTALIKTGMMQELLTGRTRLV